ncbi:FAD-dependent oxidoreductase [Pistricoccus aurantiacus]|uniref:FAD-dependent oxidoreductase n=1 Tax=Pistricoccus aurantiacus TaxID=1883414 RepID=UPI00362CA17E
MSNADRSLVLIGGGHSHVEVIRRLGLHPPPRTQLILISRERYTPYSGMLPGFVAGHYRFSDMHIDLARLCERAGATFIQDATIGLNRTERRVRCQRHSPVAYDFLSLDIGSTPQAIPGDSDNAVAVKPIPRFRERWLALLERIQDLREPREPLSIAIVGGGAAGVELILAMHYRFNQLERPGPQAPPRFSLFTRSTDILPTHNALVRRQFRRLLAKRNIELHTGCEIRKVANGWLEDGNGRRHPADETLWVTGAQGAPWLMETGLALDSAGFIQVGPTLQSVSDPRILAAGDIASLVDHPREKAGVIAVRQGPPLARNLRAALTGNDLTPYHPQRHWLSLISTGDRYAVASKGRWYLAGRWVWRWKDYIDRRFMARYQDG